MLAMIDSIVIFSAKLVDCNKYKNLQGINSSIYEFKLEPSNVSVVCGRSYVSEPELIAWLDSNFLMIETHEVIDIHL